MAGADPAGGGELPDLRARASSRPRSRRWPRSRGRPPRSTRELGVIDADLAKAIATRRRAGGRRRVRRPVPDRRVPDRLGHLVEHERQRGDRHPGRPGSWAATVHPNDHVNASQSSNDVFPSSIHLAATQAVVAGPAPGAATTWRRRWRRRRRSSQTVVKAGRTHLMDATPVTLGQEFGGYAAQVRYGVERLESALPRLAELPLGGTAVGTGINTPLGFAGRGDREAAPSSTGLPLTEAPQPLRGAGGAGRAGRDVRPAAYDRGRALQDRQRHPLDGVRPAGRACASCASPTCSPARRSCRARSTRWSPRRCGRSAPR